MGATPSSANPCLDLAPRFPSTMATRRPILGLVLAAAALAAMAPTFAVMKLPGEEEWLTAIAKHGKSVKDKAVAQTGSGRFEIFMTNPSETIDELISRARVELGF